LFYFILFETESCCVIQAGIELTTLASNSWQSSCLSLLSARIYRHAPPHPA
ncbi:hypothetical protein GW7_13865, partial [Heterocephalus glaber]